MANNSIEIPVYITPVSGNGATATNGNEYMPMPDVPEQNDIDKKKKKAEKKAKDNANAAKAFASQLIGQTVSTALSNYGNITGDYVGGQNIQVAVSETTKLVGAAMLGPWGLAAYAVGKGFELFNYHAQLKQSERDAKFAQKRVYAANRKA